MSDPSSAKFSRSPPEPRSSFIRDAMAKRQRQQQLLARVTALEMALAECLHYIAAVNGMPSDAPEHESTVNAKKLLGWTL